MHYRSQARPACFGLLVALDIVKASNSDKDTKRDPGYVSRIGVKK
jgi:hypothetical protein